MKHAVLVSRFAWISVSGNGRNKAAAPAVTIETGESFREFRCPRKREVHVYIARRERWVGELEWAAYVSQAGVYGNIIRCRRILYS